MIGNTPTVASGPGEAIVMPNLSRRTPAPCLRSDGGTLLSYAMHDTQFFAYPRRFFMEPKTRLPLILLASLGHHAPVRKSNAA